MGFKKVLVLDAEATTALGGVNKKAGKPNPKQAEGYYLGSKKIPSDSNRSGFAYLHILQTSAGNLGVWGKTDLDRQITCVNPGTMTRITCTGTKKMPKGEMYTYTVEQDEGNTIEVNTLSEPSNSYEDLAETDIDAADDFAATKTVVADRSVAASAPDAARQAKVKALLANSRAR